MGSRQPIHWAMAVSKIHRDLGHQKLGEANQRKCHLILSGERILPLRIHIKGRQRPDLPKRPLLHGLLGLISEQFDPKLRSDSRCAQSSPSVGQTSKSSSTLLELGLTETHWKCSGEIHRPSK